MSTLADSGLTHFALEADDASAAKLNECMVAHDADLHHATFAGPSRWYCWNTSAAKNEPDMAFFDMLFEVEARSIPMVGVDEAPTKSGNQYRDREMAQRVEVLTRQDSSAKILLWGGFTHHYTREKSEHLLHGRRAAASRSGA